MGVISKDKNKITLFYNSETSIGKQTNGYVSSSEKEILTVDTAKTKVTGTQWAELADNLGLEIHDLINKEHPDFIKKFGEEQIDLEEQDWLRVLEKNPELLRAPIVIDGDEYLLIENPSDFAKYIEADSAGIEPHTEGE